MEQYTPIGTHSFGFLGKEIIYMYYLLILESLPCCATKFTKMCAIQVTLMDFTVTTIYMCTVILCVHVYIVYLYHSENAQRLIQLEESAKNAGKGKWAPEIVNNPEKGIRNTKWSVESPRQFVDSYHQKPLDGKYHIYSIYLDRSKLFKMCVQEIRFKRF